MSRGEMRERKHFTEAKKPLSAQEENLKSDFYAELVNSISLSKKDEKFCSMFFQVNEAPQEKLTIDQIKKREEYRKQIQDKKSLAEKYYQYHLLQTFRSKWLMFSLEGIITHYYKNSTTLAELYKKVMGE